MQGKEVNYVCMGISVGVSLLNLIGKANISVIYDGNNLIWWWIAAVYLGVVHGKESRKNICEVEKFVWDKKTENEDKNGISNRQSNKAIQK